MYTLFVTLFSSKTLLGLFMGYHPSLGFLRSEFVRQEDIDMPTLTIYSH